MFYCAGKLNILLRKRKKSWYWYSSCRSRKKKTPTWNACIAEVYVDPSQELWIKKLTFAIDCGTVINRDGALAQIEGSALFGLAWLYIGIRI